LEDQIEEEFMVFLADGSEGIGAVRKVLDSKIVIYIENSGEFTISRDAVRDVHSKKIILNPLKLDGKLLHAIEGIHGAEDPNLVG
jgi:hypothetical protein